MRRLITVLLFLLSSTLTAKPKINWQPWTDDIFDKAKKENKMIILDVEAVWCHWCHVMEEKTYSDPKVIELINKHYIPVRVDQDSRPDISARYEDYGWPATIFFSSAGNEIAKQAGYIPPDKMTKRLDAFVKYPSTGKPPQEFDEADAPKTHSLSKAVKDAQEKLYLSEYDKKESSWGTDHKFLNWNATELAIRRSLAGDKESEKMAKDTLEKQKNLVDPIWGGVYQYSTDGVWTKPHFEKIMLFQTENIKIYALAYSAYKNEDYKKTMDLNIQYLNTFLRSPDNSYYTSQDADVVKGKHSEDFFKLNDAARRKIGIPAVDKHQYARENGWVVQALSAAYSATNNPKYRDDAIKTAEWLKKNRSLGQGGYSHDAKNSPTKDLNFLGDTLSAGQAFLSLYAITADVQWLNEASSSAQFIEANFRPTKKAEPGYWSSRNKLGGKFPPLVNYDENASLARFTNLLNQYTGDKKFQEMSQQAMRFLAVEDNAEGFSPALLLANDELGILPLHVSVVGPKNDDLAKQLYAASLAIPSTYKRLDWIDKSEKPLPNIEVQFPPLKAAAAFACSANRCSLPATKPEQIAERIEQLKKN